MSKRKNTTTPTLAPPQDEAELHELCRRLTVASIERETLIAKRDLAMQQASEPYQADIAAHDATLEQGMKALENWAVLHKDRFAEAQSVVVGGQFRVGWRMGNWATKLKSRVTWDQVVTGLQDMVAHGRKSAASKVAQVRAALAEKYLRTKIEPNKEAMLTDRHTEEAVELLTDLGVTFNQEKRFYLVPNREGQDGPELTLEGKAAR